MAVRITAEDTDTGEKYIINTIREVDEGDGWDSFVEIVLTIIRDFSVGYGAGSEKLARRQFDSMYRKWLDTGEEQEYE